MEFHFIPALRILKLEISDVSQMPLKEREIIHYPQHRKSFQPPETQLHIIPISQVATL
jgi:hypothetical protein